MRKFEKFPLGTGAKKPKIVLSVEDVIKLCYNIRKETEVTMKAIVKKQIRVIGDYELKYPLDCDADIMGKEFELHLGDLVGKILFPKLAPAFICAQATGKLEKELDAIPGPVCPINGRTWGNEQDCFGHTKWGQTMSFPKGNSLISRVMIEFYIPEDDLGTNAQIIYHHIDEWFFRFYDIFEVVSMTPLEKKKDKIPPIVPGYGFRNSGILLYAVDSQTGKLNVIHNDNDNGAHMAIDFLYGHLKYEQLFRIIGLANEQKDLTFGYRYFLEGFRAFYNEDYKKTITVCAPALEAALLSGIKTFAGSKNIYFLDKLLKKYKMLSGYFALANDIDMELPTEDYTTAIVKLRNNVVHEGYAPTREETDKYLKDVRLYLDAFSNGILAV